MKRCTKCEVKKYTSAFHLEKRAPGGIRSVCKACRKRGKLDRWLRAPWVFLLNQKEIGARCVGIEFTLTDQWMNDQPKYCPYLGLDFVLDPPGTTGGIMHPLSPTFDRIKPDGGYTTENTRLISWWANKAKGQLEDSEFRTYCLLVEERIGGRFD